MFQTTNQLCFTSPIGFHSSVPAVPRAPEDWPCRRTGPGPALASTISLEIKEKYWRKSWGNHVDGIEIQYAIYQRITMHLIFISIYLSINQINQFKSNQISYLILSYPSIYLPFYLPIQLSSSLAIQQPSYLAIWLSSKSSKSIFSI